MDVLLREKRDKAAAEAFFRSARTVTSWVPSRVTSAGPNAYPGASKAELGASHEPLFDHPVAQDQRGSKHRIRPLGGFKRVESAMRFCRVDAEVRNFLRPRTNRNEFISLAQRRILYTARTRILLTSLAAA